LAFIRSWFEWVNEFPSSVALRESLYGYPALLTAHVVTMCLFAGLIVMMDLRLVGRLHGHTRVPGQKRLFPGDDRDGAELSYRAPALLRPADAVLPRCSSG
jgi:hypothetical protein